MRPCSVLANPFQLRAIVIFLSVIRLILFGQPPLPYDNENHKGGNDHSGESVLGGNPIMNVDSLVHQVQFFATGRLNAHTTHTNRTCFISDDEGRNIAWNVPASPRLIIVGAQKAGTTAISHLLGKVPTLLRSKQSKPHFWDYVLREEDRPIPFTTELEKCKWIHRYLSYWDSDLITPDTLLFEKTPSLLALPSTAQDIRALLDPNPSKILIVLRDPVTRLYSHYRMLLQRGRLEVVDLEDNLIRDLSELQNMSSLEAPL